MKTSIVFILDGKLAGTDIKDTEDVKSHIEQWEKEHKAHITNVETHLKQNKVVVYASSLEKE